MSKTFKFGLALVFFCCLPCEAWERELAREVFCCSDPFIAVSGSRVLVMGELASTDMDVGTQPNAFVVDRNTGRTICSFVVGQMGEKVSFLGPSLLIDQKLFEVGSGRCLKEFTSDADHLITPDKHLYRYSLADGWLAKYDPYGREQWIRRSGWAYAPTDILPARDGVFVVQATRTSKTVSTVTGRQHVREKIDLRLWKISGEGKDAWKYSLGSSLERKVDDWGLGVAEIGGKDVLLLCLALKNKKTLIQLIDRGRARTATLAYVEPRFVTMRSAVLGEESQEVSCIFERKGRTLAVLYGTSPRTGGAEREYVVVDMNARKQVGRLPGCSAYDVMMSPHGYVTDKGLEQLAQEGGAVIDFGSGEEVATLGPGAKQYFYTRGFAVEWKGTGLTAHELTGEGGLEVQLSEQALTPVLSSASYELPDVVPFQVSSSGIYTPAAAAGPVGYVDLGTGEVTMLKMSRDPGQTFIKSVLADGDELFMVVEHRRPDEVCSLHLVRVKIVGEGD